ncbi:hypothetical protein OMR07_23585 [Methylobacterium organophilum]|nr:hypothetical protein [Methylobacterium organophilum]
MAANISRSRFRILEMLRHLGASSRFGGLPVRGIGSARLRLRVS